MTSIEIQVPQSVIDLLGEEWQESIGQLAGAALTEWAAWLSSSRRPMSISELETERIHTIYQQVLLDSLPSANHLGRIFDLPMGRARYISQSLNYRYGRFIRKRQVRLLLQALEEAERSDSTGGFTVTIPSAGRQLMEQTVKSLVAEQKLRSSVQGMETLDGIRYELGRGHRDVLIKTFQTLLQSFD